MSKAENPGVSCIAFSFLHWIHYAGKSTRKGQHLLMKISCLIVESQNGLGWQGIKDNLVPPPCHGPPSTKPGSSNPHPTWPSFSLAWDQGCAVFKVLIKVFFHLFGFPWELVDGNRHLHRAIHPTHFKTLKSFGEAPFSLP